MDAAGLHAGMGMVPGWRAAGGASSTVLHCKPTQRCWALPAGASVMPTATCSTGLSMAGALQGEQWEERWGEHYRRKGQASKWADKWSAVGNQVRQASFGRPASRLCRRALGALLHTGQASKWADE